MESVVRPSRGIPALAAAVAAGFVALGGLVFALADSETVELASPLTTGVAAFLLLAALIVAVRTARGRNRVAWQLLAVPTVVSLFAYIADPVEPGSVPSSINVAFWLTPVRTVAAMAALVIFAWPMLRKVSPVGHFLDSAWLGLAALVTTWGVVGEPVVDSAELSMIGAGVLMVSTVLSALLFGFVAVTMPMACDRWSFGLLAVPAVALAVGSDVFAHDYVVGSLEYGSPGDFVFLATFGLAAVAVWLRPANVSLRARNELPAARSMIITWAPLIALSGMVSLAEADVVSFQYRLGAAVAVVGVLRLSYVTWQMRNIAGDLHRRATHDPLTSLPNRAALAERVGEIDGRAAGLLMIDLDRFKAVNDTLGHAAGDQLLILVSRRVATGCGDDWTVYRLAGDEFVAFSETVIELDDVVATGRRLVDRLSLPFHLEGREAWIGASVGAAATEEGLAADELLAVADLALRTAKDSAKGEVVTADADVRRRARDRGDLEIALRHAVDRNELFSLYQPKVDLTTGAMIGMEALVRWNRPGHGVVPPGEFIAVAEASGLIARVDSWVLADGVHNLRRWNELRGTRTRLKLSTNMSAWQLARIDVDDEVTRTIAWEGGIDPAQLTIELTETLLIEDPEVVARRLRRLTDTGVGISVDDFGAGFTSVAYLRKFPISEVKIDRALVWELTGGPEDDESLAAAVIALARAMNLDVVAEGVETVEQAAALRRLGCRVAQGFLFAKPLPVEEIDALVDQAYPFADLIGDSVPIAT